MTSAITRSGSEFLALVSRSMKAKWPAFEPMCIPEGYWPQGIRFFRLNARNQCFLLVGYVFESSTQTCATYVGWNSEGTLPIPGRRVLALEGSLARVKAAAHPRDFRHEELFLEVRALLTQASLALETRSARDIPIIVATALDDVHKYGLPYLDLMLRHRHGLALRDILQLREPILH